MTDIKSSLVHTDRCNARIQADLLIWKLFFPLNRAAVFITNLAVMVSHTEDHSAWCSH